MTDTLCFQARAVYDAFNRVCLYGDVTFETDRKALAAALRAAAKTFDRPNRTDAHELWNAGFQDAQTICRRELENIADDLEGIKYGTYRCNLPNTQ